MGATGWKEPVERAMHVPRTATNFFQAELRASANQIAGLILVGDIYQIDLIGISEQSDCSEPHLALQIVQVNQGDSTYSIVMFVFRAGVTPYIYFR